MRITPKTIKNKLVPAALIAALLCSLLTSCGRVSPGVTVINGVSSRNTISKPSSDASLHFASPEEDYAKTGISSGFIDLRLDEKTGSFGIYDSSAGTLSTALPPKPEGNVLPAINSGMVNLKIIAGTDIYLLNSQDNSVAYGKSSIKQENDGCVFTFDIFPSPDTASKKIFNHS
ncbi:MAG: hypothetical protein IKI78_01385, partial [Clostridia bacterium]|nr:hypothetical protein [Clostridia bacterium]